MKKRILCVVLLAVMVSFSMLTACKAEQKTASADTPLTYYCLGEADEMYDFIKKYNKQCAINDNWDDRIEVKNFDSSQEMNSVITTELMAGSGPDFFSVGQVLPFEKMIENGTLADINELLTEYESDINFDDYNKVVMDSGVFEGKRYILPVFYCPDVLFSTQDKADALGIDPETVTYAELAELKASGEYDFVLAEDYNSTELYCSLVLQFVDIQEKKTDFNTQEFSDALEDMEILLQDDGGETEDGDLFGERVLTYHPKSFYGCSVEAVARNFGLMQDEGRELVLFPAYNRQGKVSSSVEIGIAVNRNSLNKAKLVKFIEFLLSEDTQAYHCGALRKTRMFSGGAVSLPVKNSVLDYAFEVELEDVYDSNLDDEISDSDLLINEKKNTFLSEKLRPFIDSIGECRLYGSTLNRSYYETNIIGDILYEYFEGRISRDELVSRMDSATVLYLTE